MTKWEEIMMVCLHLVNLLLLINILDLSSSQNATRPRSHPPEEDYYNTFEDSTTISPSLMPTSSEPPELDRCNYDLCVEQQQTCAELAEVSPCLCPGLSEKFHPPSSPRLLYLTQQDDKGVMVHWCAPTSFVTHYIVLVKGKDKVEDRKIQVGESKRATLLQDVAAGALVCVIAENKGGASTENGESCATFEPQHSDSGLALKLGIIGGVVGFVVLLILALLLWRHKIRRKSTALNETRGVL